MLDLTLISPVEHNSEYMSSQGAGPVKGLVQLLGNKLVSGNVIDIMMHQQTLEKAVEL